MPTSGKVRGREAGRETTPFVCMALAALLIAAGGCSEQAGSDDKPAAAAASTSSGVPATEYADFKDGPDDAPVKVVAYYPGRHEDTLAAVKSLRKTFGDQVQVEIVDWRREEGMKRRSDAGLTCAGIAVNGKFAFDLDVDGRHMKVLFQRAMGGEWTKTDLERAVRQELEKKGKK